MKTVTEFPRAVALDDDVGIEMADGCRLSARVWMPRDAVKNPVPTILEFLPYRKRDGTTARDCLTHPWFAGHGYACLRVDMRGNGDSEGIMEDEYTDQEWDDACAVIAWAAAQPWCNGRVGMMGISWGGFNALQVAALRPPALKAIITICSTGDRYADDIHYKGGCLLGENAGWAAQMLSYSSRPPDPAIVGRKWREMWRERLESQPFHLTEWLTHQHRDAYWQRGSVCEDYGAIDAAVLSIGGWHDGYRNTISHLVTNLKAPVKGIVGPWIHKYPHFAAPQPAIGFLQEAKRWWDRWLKDIDTGVEADPAMRLWLMDSVRPAAWHPERPGRWIAEAEWPSANIAAHSLHLTGDGLSDAPGDLPVHAGLVASPQHCGLAGGEYFPFMYGPELPSDQRGDDALSACFDSAPLNEGLDIVGAPEIRLTVSADRPQANLCVRLCDVHPDGASELISYGVLNLAQRASRSYPEPLEPGVAYDVTVVLDQCAYAVPAGHRLRVAVSTAFWPMIWPSPAPTTVTLKRGVIDLPVRTPSAGAEWGFEPPEAAAPWNTRKIRESSAVRRAVHDAMTGLVTVIIENDFGAVEDLDHGLVTDSRVREEWTIHPDDPLSATVEFVWEQAGGRGDWQWRTAATSRLTATDRDFVLSARLEAFEGNAKIFERAFRETIGRDNL